MPPLFTSSISDQQISEYTKVPGLNIRPSLVDKARTITHVCSSGTLCTSSVMDDVQGFPFGSYVDYILDENGRPVLLLSEKSLHTLNICSNPCVSLFAQLPRQSSQSAAGLSRVTLMGRVESVPQEELSALAMAFTLIHQYAEQIVDSPKFKFYRIKPEKIYFSGGFGVMATWVDVAEYEAARPDALASEVPQVLARVNIDKQGELLLICKHFLNLNDVEIVRIQAIDRLGIDLRVKTGTTFLPLLHQYCRVSLLLLLLLLVNMQRYRLVESSSSLPPPPHHHHHHRHCSYCYCYHPNTTI